MWGKNFEEQHRYRYFRLTYFVSSYRDESSSSTHLRRVSMRLISDEFKAFKISTAGSPKCKWKRGGIFSFEKLHGFWSSFSKQLSILSNGYAATEVETRCRTITRQKKTDTAPTIGLPITGTFEDVRLKITSASKRVPRISLKSSIVDKSHRVICAASLQSTRNAKPVFRIEFVVQSCMVYQGIWYHNRASRRLLWNSVFLVFLFYYRCTSIGMIQNWGCCGDHHQCTTSKQFCCR